MEIDRRLFIASLGGAAAVAAMNDEAKADAIEHYMEERLDQAVSAQQGGAPEKFPTVAEIEAQIETRDYRRGAGSLFTAPPCSVSAAPAARQDRPQGTSG